MEIGTEIVFADPKTGKSQYVAICVLDDYMDEYNENYEAFVEHVKWYNKTYGTNLTLPPQEHVVNSNLTIQRDFPYARTYDISGFDFGKPTPFLKLPRLMKYGVYVFDEAHEIWPSSKQMYSLPPWVTQCFNELGHLFIKAYLIAPDYKMIHPDVRKTARVYTKIESSIHTYKRSSKRTFKDKRIDLPYPIIKTTITGVKFQTENEIERYLNGEKVGEPFKKIHYGDIRDNYDPFEYGAELEDSGSDYTYGEVCHKTRPPEWKTYRELEKKMGEKIDEIR